jgi:acyl-CoA thioesterase YciA
MLITRDHVLEKDIGLNGALFGGEMMARMDLAAGIFAGLHGRNGRFVTAKVSELRFLSPVRAGDLIEFYGSLARKGNTSLAVALEVKVYNPVSGQRRDVTSGEFVMVAVDGNLHPEPILWKELDPEPPQSKIENG